MSTQSEPASVDSGVVMTVCGPIDPAELGFTLMHEHLLAKFWHATHRYDLSGMPEDQRYIANEMDGYAALGGTTLVDVTPVGINRQPDAIRKLSEESGLNVVMGCGWYREHYYPVGAEIERRSVQSLADDLVQEIHHGAGATGIRPGIIGEIGTEKDWMSPSEERVHRAAGRAAAATGLAVMTHSFASTIGEWQLGVLQEEGVAPDRVVIGHADTYQVRDYHLKLLRKGANLEFDTLAWYRPALFDVALDLLADYIHAGYLSQLLVSLDTCKAEHLKFFGGGGLAGIHERIIPALRKRGLGDQEFDAIWRSNPRRILTVPRTTGGK